MIRNSSSPPGTRCRSTLRKRRRKERRNNLRSSRTEVSLTNRTLAIRLLGSTSQAGLRYSRQLITTEIFSLVGTHDRHRNIRFAVVVGGVPEQKSNSTFVLGGQH